MCELMHELVSAFYASTRAKYPVDNCWLRADMQWYLWFIGLGGALYCGYLFLIMGSRLGELSFISPFKYISIIIAIIYGYLIWGDQPTLSMLAGAIIIVLSGIILVSTEKRRNRNAKLAPQSQ